MKIPYLQIRSNCLIYYELADHQPGRGNLETLKGQYSGKVTNGAKKRISKAIDILVQKSSWRNVYNPITQKTFPFRLNFVTLTLSTQETVDVNFVYNGLLKPFLRKMRKHGNFSYVWKAEFQSDKDFYGRTKEGGGQLHYHLATNVFLPWTEVRSEWNKLQRKAGFLYDYAIANASYDPNSIDVHAVQSINDLSAYLGKYMSKDQTKIIKGKVWDCSKDLKINRFSFVLSNYSENRLRADVAAKKVQQIDLDHCTIFKTAKPLNYIAATDFIEYQKWKV